MATCSKTFAYTPCAYSKKIQSFDLGSSFSQRVSRMWTCDLHPKKGRLWRLGFCPHIASNGDTIPLFKVIGVLFLMNAAMVAAYCQYPCPRLALIMRYLAISMIILFNQLAQPFCCGVQSDDLFHLIPCSFRYSCISLLAYLHPSSVLKHFTFIPRCRLKAIWQALNSFNC